MTDTAYCRHFQAELSALHQLGKAFSREHPSLAPHLGEVGNDPDVERLLEGFAFLTARLRERIDRAVPEVAESLSASLFPHSVRPTPATAVVAFQPDLRSLRAVQVIPQGTELQSIAIRNTRCRFRTIGSLDLLPLTLRVAQLDESRPDTPCLRLTFDTTTVGREVCRKARRLRIFLLGSRPQRSTLALWLERHLRDIQLLSENRSIQLPTEVVSQALQRRDEATIPWPSVSLEGPRRLREFLKFPEKGCFYDFDVLGHLPPGNEKSFSLVLHFRRPPALPEALSTHQFQLHCAAVVNLFEVQAEPLLRKPFAHEFSLRAVGMPYSHAEVFDVLRVTGSEQGQRRHTYVPQHDLHFLQAERSSSAYGYQLQRRCSPVDGRLDTYLVLESVYPDKTSRKETIAADLLCTNRLLPAELRIGDISEPTPSCPTRAPFRNISPVNLPTMPPLPGAAPWQLLAQLSSSFEAWSEPTALLRELALHMTQQDSDPRFRGNQQRCTSIRSVDTQPSPVLHQGLLVQGIATTLVLEESHFEGLGDAYQFARVLNVLLADRVGIDSYHTLKVCLHPSHVSWSFSPENGMQQPL